MANLISAQPEQDVDPRRLNIRIDNSHTLALEGQQSCDVRRYIRFTGSTPERVD
jgi:hypothetical protein